MRIAMSTSIDWVYWEGTNQREALVWWLQSMLLVARPPTFLNFLLSANR
jgi:hypothetical protein